MITAYYSSILDHPVDRVWTLVRDFNNYPAYIDGVSESVIEDDKRGDEEGAVRRYTFTTPGAQRIQLDDQAETITIENSNGDFIRLAPEEVRLGDNQGSLIELTPGRCRIHAAADLEIGAPGKKVTISGQAIDFERA